ncbi:trypsin-like peptidase domain-containing protein [Actinoplanes sp. NBC_00393]|uniref:S1C family serine protease n=1 Tax=Actinoplanes sp. NBC_00393 TaxID=2975953 RepID=UPI002E1F0CE2
MSASYEPFTPANGSDHYRSGGRRRADERWNGEPAWNSAPVQEEPRWSYSQQQAQYEQPQYQQYEQWPQQQQWASQQQPEPQWPAPQQQQWAVPEPQLASPAASATGRTGRGRVMIIALVAALLAVSAWQAFRVESMIKSSSDLASAVTAEQGRTQELEKQLATVFDPEGISSAVLPSVFRVRAGDFTGTAFAVGKTDGGDTNLFTNYHVVEEVFAGGDRKVTLERGETRIEATIVRVNEGRDLALLRADQDIKALTPAPGEVKSGQQVVVVGAPLGLEDSVTTGVISAFRKGSAEGPTIQFDAPINPGNSGGPVVNSSRQVVGIATAKARDAEGIGLAIPIETACSTLKVCANN